MDLAACEGGVRAAVQKRSFSQRILGTILGNISSQSVWAIIQLSKPRMLCYGACDQIFQAPFPRLSSCFFGREEAWVRG